MLDNAWIGGSMDISYELGRLVICGYRSMKKKVAQNTETGTLDIYYLMQGSCYWFYVDGGYGELLLPLDKQKTQGNKLLYSAQGQAGISVHMPSNKGQLVLGAPGLYSWNGTSILYIDEVTENPEQSKLVRTKRATVNVFHKEIIADDISYTRNLYGLLGYSTTSGYFYGKQNLYYVSGAPSYGDYLGKVIIYLFSLDKGPFNIKEIKTGDQFGEYFGASLTVGDLDNDGFDDLIVGAPFYYKNQYNEGKVYIFMGNETNLSAFNNSPSGNSTNGQFGTCVQYLGDINSDGFGEIAVSAPYEEEKSGVVYIYRGSEAGIDINYSQRIIGKDILSEILGFGISISRAADIDHNHFKDVAIGAYLSGHVVILRTLPVATVYHNLTFFFSYLDYQKDSFNISVCFWYNVNQSSSNISIRRFLEVDLELGRAKLRDANVGTIHLLQKQKICENLTVLFRKPFLNRYDPITFSLWHEFIPKERPREVLFVSENDTDSKDLFCDSCSVYDKLKSSPLLKRKIPFQLNCRSDNICISSLHFKTFLTNTDDSSFVLGLNNTVTLKTIIKNQGENAYLTKVIYVLPHLVNLQSTPPYCMEENFTLICDVDNPLRANHTKIMTLDLDMTNLDNVYGNDDPLNITVKVQTSSEDDQKNFEHLQIKLRREADVTISGMSEENVYAHRNDKVQVINVTQVYMVETYGSSSINEICVEIHVPHFIKTKEDILRRVVHLNLTSGIIDGPEDIECYNSDENNKKDFCNTKQLFTKPINLKNNDSRKQAIPTADNVLYINCTRPEIYCSKIHCIINSIKPRQVAKVKINTFLNISAVKNFLDDSGNVLFTTFGQVMIRNPEFVQSGNRSDVTEVTSLIVGENVKSVPIWITILAVITGLLLILLLIYGLKKARFFQRETRDRLEQLRRESEHEEDGPQEDTDAEM